MKIKDIVNFLEDIAPLSLQEEYDNSGLITGNNENNVNAVLLAIDVTEEVIDEAISIGADMIISHHPVIFSGIKKLTGGNYVERIIIKAIKNNIAIYAAHTNFDSISDGVNSRICDKLELINTKILSSSQGKLKKLVTFIPVKYIDKVRDAIFEAGAGMIGKYDKCSFNVVGDGTFRASENSTPFIGDIGKIHDEKEIRFETVFPEYLKSKIINVLINTHPYEEVAYDIYPLENNYNKIGMGMIGELQNKVDTKEFLFQVKNIFNTEFIKHTKIIKNKIKKIAVCGGSGSFLLKNAIKKGADIFISADFKYHQFFDSENKIIIVDIGHYESEQFTKDIFYEILTKKFPKFAFHLTKINTNPIKYL
ncbi:MAG: Nif3-like dinuclear metal center hexameric protein [Bacteroidales bacterium]|nr:Nif3-like dinuclear metal center hexameric protein [Bacteroidales bacterium]